MNRTSTTQKAECEDFVRTNASYVARTLYRFGVREPELEDVTQDVLLSIVKNYDRFEGETETSSAKLWIYAFAYNYASNHYRRMAKRRTREVHDGVSLFEADTEAPDEVIARRELTQAGLAALPFEQKAVLILHDIDGCTAAEISRTLGVPAGTVASRLRLGREKFRKAVIAAKENQDAAKENQDA